MNALAITVGGGGLQHLLITFLILVIVLAVIGGLIYLIEQWVNRGPLPGPVRLVIALVLVVLVIIWGIQVFAPGG